MDTNQLQQLLAQAQPQGNPEDPYLAQLGQAQTPLEYDPNLFSTPSQPKENRMSDSGVGALEGRYNQAKSLQYGQHGLGSLSGAIQAMILGPKLRKAQAGREANNLRLEDIKAQKDILANDQATQVLKQEKQKVLDQEGMNALSNIQLGNSSNIAEDIKLAKGELTENGSPKTHIMKFQENLSQGKYGNVNFQGLVSFDPSLVGLGSQVYSQYTEKAFNDALNAASKAKQKHESDLLEVRKASISKGETQLDAWKAYGNLVENYAKGATALADYSIDPEIKNEIYANLQRTAKAINTMGFSYHLTNKDTMLNPSDIANAVLNQDTDAFMKNLTNINNLQNQGVMMMNKPAKSPDRVKDKAAPLPVGTTTPPVNQKALQVLGE